MLCVSGSHVLRVLCVYHDFINYAACLRPPGPLLFNKLDLTGPRLAEVALSLYKPRLFIIFISLYWQYRATLCNTDCSNCVPRVSKLLAQDSAGCLNQLRYGARSSLHAGESNRTGRWPATNTAKNAVTLTMTSAVIRLLWLRESTAAHSLFSKATPSYSTRCYC